MTERLADVTARIENVRQLDSVVAAMRGIAAGRAQQARARLVDIEAYSATVSRAIGQALSFLVAASPSRRAPEHGALILFCAEQGFAGAFSDRVLDAAGDDATKCDLMIVGSRGAAIARERGIAPGWTTTMASQVNGVTVVANRIADALYRRIVEGGIARARVLYPRLDENYNVRVAGITLLPLDLETFRLPEVAIKPLTTLPPQRLIERLTGEYINARLCEAAMQAFAAENQARLQAMSSAGSNIDRTLAELQSRANQVRQEEVTAEIVELSAGRQEAPSYPGA